MRRGEACAVLLLEVRGQPVDDQSDEHHAKYRTGLYENLRDQLPLKGTSDVSDHKQGLIETLVPKPGTRKGDEGESEQDPQARLYQRLLSLQGPIFFHSL